MRFNRADRGSGKRPPVGPWGDGSSRGVADGYPSARGRRLLEARAESKMLSHTEARSRQGYGTRTERKGKRILFYVQERRKTGKERTKESPSGRRPKPAEKQKSNKQNETREKTGKNKGNTTARLPREALIRGPLLHRILHLFVLLLRPRRSARGCPLVTPLNRTVVRRGGLVREQWQPGLDVERSAGVRSGGQQQEGTRLTRYRRRAPFSFWTARRSSMRSEMRSSARPMGTTSARTASSTREV
jgi:hypothetical protein